MSVASKQSYADVVKLLIDRGAEIEMAEQNGYTPLMRALWRNQEKVIEVLQQGGARCQPVEILDEPTSSEWMAAQK